MAAHSHFFTYVYHCIVDAPLYERWKAFLAYLRRFRAIAVFLRIVTLFFAVLETGTLVILGTALFLVILPLIGVLMLSVLLTALLESRRSNQKMRRVLAKKRVHVLFLPEGQAEFLRGHASSLAASGDAVILISPYWISSRGLCKRTFYFTMREEAPNLYLIRRYYFFSIKKRVLSDLPTVMFY